MKLNSGEIREIRKENLRWPITLTPLPRTQWPTIILSDTDQDILIEVYRSRTHLVQVFHQQSHGSITRLSIQSTEYDERHRRFKDGITWDVLMRLKTEAGYGDRCALELFPPDDKIVNVANIRHLFLYPPGQHPSFMWV